MEKLFNELQTDYVQNYTLSKDPFNIPVLPKAQCIVIPLIREVVAPIVVRNNDSDTITGMVFDKHTHARMIASKTKSVERRRGAQILRALTLGGAAAANKAYIPEGMKPSDVFDLNTFVFGDAANSKSNVYPVHSAVLYSDAISILPLARIQDDVFRTGGIAEDGGNYDTETKKSSNNIFITRSVYPGTLFVQSLVLLGNRITQATLNHLLLSIGLSGSYGGTTATTGTNIRTRVAGIFWGSFERDINAPSQMLKLFEQKKAHSLQEAITILSNKFGTCYPHSINDKEVNTHIEQLIHNFESNQTELITEYRDAATEIIKLFDNWFSTKANETKTKKNTK